MVLSKGLKTSLLFIDVTVRLCNVNAENMAQTVMDTVVFILAVLYVCVYMLC